MAGELGVGLPPVWQYKTAGRPDLRDRVAAQNPQLIPDSPTAVPAPIVTPVPVPPANPGPAPQNITVHIGGNAPAVSLPSAPSPSAPSALNAKLISQAVPNLPRPDAVPNLPRPDLGAAPTSPQPPFNPSATPQLDAMSVGQRIWTAFQNLKSSDVPEIAKAVRGPGGLAKFTVAAFNRGYENASAQEKQSRLTAARYASMAAGRTAINEAMASNDPAKIQDAHFELITNMLQFSPPDKAQNLVEDMLKAVGQSVEQYEKWFTAKQEAADRLTLERARQGGETERAAIGEAGSTARAKISSDERKEIARLQRGEPTYWKTLLKSVGGDPKKAIEKHYAAQTTRSTSRDDMLQGALQAGAAASKAK